MGLWRGQAGENPGGGAARRFVHKYTAAMTAAAAGGAGSPSRKPKHRKHQRGAPCWGAILWTNFSSLLLGFVISYFQIVGTFEGGVERVRGETIFTSGRGSEHEMAERAIEEGGAAANVNVECEMSACMVQG